jgi:hypothetical protein
MIKLKELELAKEALINGTLTVQEIDADINKGFLRKDFKDTIRNILRKDAKILLKKYGSMQEWLMYDIPYEKKWTSSDGQDKLVAQIFKNKKSFFVELGGDDGLRKSNTYGLESFLNWEGLVVESRPIFNESCKKKRKCKCVCETVYSEEKVVSFDIHTEVGGTSGISGLFDKFSAQSSGHSYFTFTKKLETIFKENNVPKSIGYLSMDIEGAEYDALKNFPFDKYNILLISFEDHEENKNNNKLKNLLIKNNYRHLTKLRLDDFWILNQEVDND